MSGEFIGQYRHPSDSSGDYVAFGEPEIFDQFTASLADISLSTASDLRAAFDPFPLDGVVFNHGFMEVVKQCRQLQQNGFAGAASEKLEMEIRWAFIVDNDAIIPQPIGIIATDSLRDRAQSWAFYNTM